MFRPSKRKTQSSFSSSTTSIHESDNLELSGLVEANASKTTAFTPNTLRDGTGSTMSALTMAEEADGGVDDPRKPLLGTAVAGVIRTKLQAKNRNLDDGSYNATTISKSISSLQCEGRAESEQEEAHEDEDDEEQDEEHIMENISRKSQWILLAVASGACAAFNGVFAKL